MSRIKDHTFVLALKATYHQKQLPLLLYLLSHQMWNAIRIFVLFCFVFLSSAVSNDWLLLGCFYICWFLEFLYLSSKNQGILLTLLKIEKNLLKAITKHSIPLCETFNLHAPFPTFQPRCRRILVLLCEPSKIPKSAIILKNAGFAYNANCTFSYYCASANFFCLLFSV